MRIAITFLLLISWTQTLPAQKSINLDSLQSIFANESLPNKERLDAIKYGVKVLENNSVDLMDCFILEDIITKLKNIEYDIGKTELISGLFQKILTLLETSSCTHMKIGDCYERLAHRYLNIGNFSMSIDLNLKALSLYESKDGSYNKIGRVFENLGFAHSHLGDLYLEEKYLSRSVESHKLGKDSSVLAYRYMSLMTNQQGQKKLESAMLYIDSAIMISQAVNDEISLAKNYASKADLLLSLNLPREALRLQLESLPVIEAEAKDKGWYGWTAHLYGNIGKSHLALKEYEKALNSGTAGFEYAYSISEKKGNQEVIYKSLDGLGRKAAAFDAYKKYIILRDSVFNGQNIKEATTLEMNYKFQQERFSDSLEVVRLGLEKEMEFHQKLSREKMNRNIFIALGIGIFLFAIGLISRLRFIRKTKLELEAKNLLIEAETKRAKASEIAKQQFLANMSHEIRTPMNAIKGMTDILLRKNPQSEQLSYLQAIKESSNSLLVIINDILDISKMEAGKINIEKIPFSLFEVVQNVGTIMQFKAEEKGLLLQNKMPSNIHEQIVGDPTRLHQILLNLIGNGIKFTDKGIVSCEVKSTRKLDENFVEVQFCISDTGVGIGKDRLEKIFDTFEQAYSDTTRKFGGTGLGLSIAKKLVELQNGRIWVESEKNKGSQFYFSIPYQIAEQIAPYIKSEDLVPNETHSDALKGIKILLVEDNSFNAIVAQEELEDAIEDVQVDVAENGLIAVEKVKIGNYDIILMDVQMPIMNGYEATQKIRSLNNGETDIPIIAMTANVMKDEVERYFKAGMNDFIGKPFDTMELIQKISNQLLRNK